MDCIRKDFQLMAMHIRYGLLSDPVLMKIIIVQQIWLNVQIRLILTTCHSYIPTNGPNLTGRPLVVPTSELYIIGPYHLFKMVAITKN
jgi:hypothetical protein